MKFSRYKSANADDLRTAIYHGDEGLSIVDGVDVVLKAAALAHHRPVRRR